MLATSLGAVFKLIGVGIQAPFSWFQERAKSEAGATPIQGPFLQWFSTCGLPLLGGGSNDPSTGLTHNYRKTQILPL